MSQPKTHLQTPSIHCLSRGVIIEQNHLLVSRNPRATHPYVYLPGGHIEEGESAEQTLVREMIEETSLLFKVDRFIGVLEYSFVPNNSLQICHTHEYNFCFLASCPALKNLQLPPEPEKDKVRFQWVPLPDLSRSNLLPAPLINLLPIWLKTASSPSVFSSEMI